MAFPSNYLNHSSCPLECSGCSVRANARSASALVTQALKINTGLPAQGTTDMQHQIQRHKAQLAVRVHRHIMQHQVQHHTVQRPVCSFQYPAAQASQARIHRVLKAQLQAVNTAHNTQLQVVNRAQLEGVQQGGQKNVPDASLCADPAKVVSRVSAV